MFTPFAFVKQEITTPPTPPSFAFLLDDFPGDKVSYSLRKLKSAYAGNCVEVRRSSDDTAQNIGFVDNVLDTASLLSFVGAGDGFVKTWYDQSGNTLNATQTTTGSQPQIVSSGSVILENSLPTLQGGDNIFLSFSPSVTQPNTTFIVAKSDGTNSRHFYDTTARQLIGYTTNLVMFAGTTVVSYSSKPLTFQVVNAVFSGSSSSLQSNNGSITTGNPGTAGMGSNSILMTGNGNGGYIGVMSEFIVYDSNQGSNRSGINTNINNFYGIY
jgi:hypothetical protein